MAYYVAFGWVSVLSCDFVIVFLLTFVVFGITVFATAYGSADDGGVIYVNFVWLGWLGLF